MNKLIKRITLTMVLILLSGCSLFKPADITINPKVNPPKTDIGKGKTVVVGLQDVRDSTMVGYRGQPEMSGDIYVDQSQLLNMKTAVADILKAKGFVVTSPYKSDRILIIRFVLLKSELVDKLTSFGTHRVTTAAFYIDARNHNKTYSKIYRGIIDTASIKVAMVSFLQEQINLAISQALNQVVMDHDLWTFLAK